MFKCWVKFDLYSTNNKAKTGNLLDVFEETDTLSYSKLQKRISDTLKPKNQIEVDIQRYSAALSQRKVHCQFTVQCSFSSAESWCS